MRMDISRNGGDVAFRTAFSDEYELIQVLCGLSSTPDRNCPVDFRMAGLQRKGHPDIWHVDQVLAFSTDECSPLVINGEDIGGNHGHPCAVRVKAPQHGKDVRDIGSRWADEGGMHFTLLRVESDSRLLFISDNIGPSETAYHFAQSVTGSLHYVDNGVHTDAIIPQAQTGGVQLTPAIRHLKREAVCFRDGCWEEIGGWMEGCERAEIREVYEIINPATVARAIHDGRPAYGYTREPSLAAGESMFLHQMTYRIEADGTILCDFEHQVQQDVHMPYYLGIMHQEKCDLYGGGVWRYIPKLNPFKDCGRRMDFSTPFLTTAETMPRNRRLTKDLWTDPASPPDRQIDFIRTPDGRNAVAFATGFLPLYDGFPEKRAASVTEAATLVRSCKTYPTFAGGTSEVRHPHRESRDGAMHFPRLRGIAYKKYFQPVCDTASVYTVPEGKNTYVYMDFYAEMPQTTELTAEPRQQVTLLESNLQWQRETEKIRAEGCKGYACFKMEASGRKG